MVTVQPSTNHLLIGAKRICNAGQSDTHLAKGDSNMGVARNSQPKAELLRKTKSVRRWLLIKLRK